MELCSALVRDLKLEAWIINRNHQLVHQETRKGCGGYGGYTRHAALSVVPIVPVSLRSLES